MIENIIDAVKDFVNVGRVLNATAGTNIELSSEELNYKALEAFHNRTGLKELIQLSDSVQTTSGKKYPAFNPNSIKNYSSLQNELNTDLGPKTGDRFKTLPVDENIFFNVNDELYVNMVQLGMGYASPSMAQSDLSSKFKTYYNLLYRTKDKAEAMNFDDIIKKEISINKGIDVDEINVVRTKDGWIDAIVYTGSDKREDVVPVISETGVEYQNHILFLPSKKNSKTGEVKLGENYITSYEGMKRLLDASPKNLEEVQAYYDNLKEKYAQLNEEKNLVDTELSRVAKDNMNLADRNQTLADSLANVETHPGFGIGPSYDMGKDNKGIGASLSIPLSDDISIIMRGIYGLENEKTVDDVIPNVAPNGITSYSKLSGTTSDATSYFGVSLAKFFGEDNNFGVAVGANYLLDKFTKNLTSETQIKRPDGSIIGADITPVDVSETSKGYVQPDVSVIYRGKDISVHANGSFGKNTRYRFGVRLNF